MTWLLTLWSWIRQDWKRFGWEVALAAILAGVSWGVGYFLNNNTLQACQDERTVLLKQTRQLQAEVDKIHYEGLLSAKDLQISAKDEKILELNRKIASDSIQHLSELDAIRAINQYVQKGKARK
ncbi:hypothetical protein GO730_20955 [Spirosoma sp. HMF3257]|uniref:Uncharacterized protein n=1 Tax=Spirosoma telluris TaxID=2183553 RepID=A0A327NTF5_9BACT|nr:hypothetical protein [Spirosoma telluris]RAI76018.1 hypothetical protein HMF3257_20880 [Spirosoma telluris]